MRTNVLLSVYKSEADLFSAVRSTRERGLRILDIYTPYAVHGLDRAAGFRRSRLPIACFLLGVFGAAFTFWVQYWTTAVDWPINVGGKPWNSWPAFIPITFEMMVLFAGVGSVLVLFAVAGLWPGKRAKLIAEGITNDRFALLIAEEGPTFSYDEVQALCERSRAVIVEPRCVEVSS